MWLSLHQARFSGPNKTFAARGGILANGNYSEKVLVRQEERIPVWKGEHIFVFSHPVSEGEQEGKKDSCFFSELCRYFCEAFNGKQTSIQGWLQRRWMKGQLSP